MQKVYMTRTKIRYTAVKNKNMVTDGHKSASFCRREEIKKVAESKCRQDIEYETLIAAAYVVCIAASGSSPVPVEAQDGR